MFRRYEVDVVATFLLQIQHDGRQAIRRHFDPGRSLADVEILTKNALQIAVGEEDGTRAAPSLEAVLLSKMGKKARDHTVTARQAHSLAVR